MTFSAAEIESFTLGINSCFFSKPLAATSGRWLGSSTDRVRAPQTKKKRTSASGTLGADGCEARTATSCRDPRAQGYPDSNARTERVV